MKKNYFLCAMLLSSISVFSQKTILVNGGQFGNPNENANVVIYDYSTNNYTTLDTIQTQSVQDVLIDGNSAFVAAQDSIVKYDLVSETRVAAAAFNGASTKTFQIHQNELLVGNWFARDSNNLYIYNTNNLNLVDSIPALSKGAKSILIHNGFAYITQNNQTANFEDTLGSIVRLDIANRNITDTIVVSGYNGDFGELVKKPNGLGFYAFNAVSNTITTVDFNNLNGGVNLNSSLDLDMSSRSHWATHNDTLFGRIGRNIASINLNNLQYLDSNMVDTAITSFTYDTLNRLFFATYTDFSSIRTGYVYSSTGIYLSALSVGFSPEVIDMYYSTSVGLNEIADLKLDFQFYPNPATNEIRINLKEVSAQFRLFDVNGRLVYEDNLTQGINRVDISAISRGKYFIQLVSQNVMNTEVLIKQ